jgi:hypothetical protein
VIVKQGVMGFIFLSPQIAGSQQTVKQSFGGVLEVHLLIDCWSPFMIAAQDVEIIFYAV